MGDPKELVGIAAIASVGRAGQCIFGRRVVQRVVELRNGARRVAERRVGGHIGDTLAIDVYLATIAQALKVFLASKGPVGCADEILGLDPTRRLAHSYPPRI